MGGLDGFGGRAADALGELDAFGAPSDLVSRARSASRDEVRHTRITARLARRFGDGIRALRDSGELARIMSRYGLEDWLVAR